MKNYTKTQLKVAEQIAVQKFPKDGFCKKSCFASKQHRAGYVPFSSILDGATPGDVANCICLECGKTFVETVFVPLDQPRELCA